MISRFPNSKTMATNKQQRVMHMAHILYRRQQELSIISTTRPDWSGALGEAWKMQRVREALHSGVVQLRYLTENGNVNSRRGTLNADLIPGSKMPKGIQDELIRQGMADPQWGVISYYDLDKKAWRSLKIINLLSVLRLDYQATVETSYPAQDEWIY